MQSHRHRGAIGSGRRCPAALFRLQSTTNTQPMRLHLLATLVLVPVLQAQQAHGGPDPDRRAATVFVANDNSETLAAVSVSYSPPSWNDSYDGMLKALESSNYTRLGKGWWTTFDTVGLVEIGGTKIEAGSYYLGLAVGKDGAFSLLLFDSRQAMKNGLLPGNTALYRGEVAAAAKAPLQFAMDSLQEVVVKIEIEITADMKDPSTGRFSIRWGRHELSAPVKFQLATAKGLGAPKK